MLSNGIGVVGRPIPSSWPTAPNPTSPHMPDHLSWRVATRPTIRRGTSSGKPVEPWPTTETRALTAAKTTAVGRETSWRMSERTREGPTDRRPLAFERQSRHKFLGTSSQFGVCARRSIHNQALLRDDSSSLFGVIKWSLRRFGHDLVTSSLTWLFQCPGATFFSMTSKCSTIRPSNMRKMPKTQTWPSPIFMWLSVPAKLPCSLACGPLNAA